MTYKLSSLWVQIGQINKLGNFEDYEKTLTSLVENEPLIQAMTIRDQSGEELEIYPLKEGQVEMHLGTANSFGSLGFQRKKAGLSFVGTSNKAGEPLKEYLHSSSIKLSRPYVLP